MNEFGKVLFLEGDIGLDDTTREAYNLFEDNERVILDDLYKTPENLSYISEEIKPDTIMLDTTNFFATKVNECKVIFRKINYVPENLIVGSYTAFETFEDIIVPMMDNGMRTFLFDSACNDLIELDNSGDWLDDGNIGKLETPDEFHK